LAYDFGTLKVDGQVHPVEKVKDKARMFQTSRVEDHPCRCFRDPGLGAAIPADSHLHIL
jgi:hypothetical protein